MKTYEGDDLPRIARPSVPLGRRTLIAMTCWGCGKFLPGSTYGFHTRNVRDKSAYIDRRCTNCKWGAKLKGRP